MSSSHNCQVFNFIKKHSAFYILKVKIDNKMKTKHYGYFVIMYRSTKTIYYVNNLVSYSINANPMTCELLTVA